MPAVPIFGRICLIMEHFSENIVIVTDTLLLEVGSLIENEIVTPSTLFALNSLIQAVTLHDKVILGLCGFVGERSRQLKPYSRAWVKTSRNFLMWGIWVNSYRRKFIRRQRGQKRQRGQVYILDRFYD